MQKLTFRIDDVSQNTNHNDLFDMLHLLNTELHADVLICISMFCKGTHEGSVYPNPPFKDMPTSKFYDTDTFTPSMFSSHGKIVSHGLYHVDHSVLSRDAQEMSILGSCRYLKTDTFVPPFNRFNKTTERICQDYGIKLIKSTEEDWLSLEHNEFNINHRKWYFHPWRFAFAEFKEALLGTHTRRL